MSVDLSKIRESKRALRERLRTLPVSEKLRMLDAMREAAVRIRSAKAIRVARVHEQPDIGMKR